MTKNEELLMDGCKLLGMSFEDFLTVYQILLTQEQVIEMLIWMKDRIESNPHPMDIIQAACEIQERHRTRCNH